MQIGDYVRYKNGEIEQIHSFAEKDNPLFNILINARYHNTNEIKKYGKPIDLIEVGDYVNGREVRKVYDLGFGKCFCFKNEYGRHYDKTYKIKSILTKEQFERMEYKI